MLALSLGGLFLLASASTPNLIPGGCAAADLSGDGIVDSNDLGPLFDCWGTDCGDINGDGETGLADLGELFAQLGCRVIYVDAAADPNGDGSSWESAFQVLPPAITLAQDRDEVLVRPGTYVGAFSINGKDFRLTATDGCDETTLSLNFAPIGARFLNVSRRMIVQGFTLTGGGTAISCVNASPTIAGCRMTGNKAYAGRGGGGVDCVLPSTEPLFLNCEIIDNRSDFRGGGVVAQNGAAPLFVGCVIARNRATDPGGGIATIGAGVRLEHCVVTDNLSLAGYGSGIYCGIPTPGLPNDPLLATNCIIFDNQLDEIAVQAGAVGPELTFCCVRNGWPGAGNIAADPGFSYQRDYHLRSGSPCIDAGTPLEGGLFGGTDPDGVLRLLDGDGDGAATPDIGLFEYTPNAGTLAVDRPGPSLHVPEGELAPVEGELRIRNVGGQAISWSVAGQADWLSIPTTMGTLQPDQEAVLPIVADPAGLDAGVYTAALAFSSPDASNGAQGGRVTFSINRELHVPAQFATIQEALDAAVPGDVVLLAPGLYRGEGNRALTFNGKAVTLRGDGGAAQCVIDCEYETLGICFQSNETRGTIVEGITIRNALLHGISCYGASPVISACILEGTIVGPSSSEPCSRRGDGGGLIVWRGSDPIVRDCVFRENTASSGGGAYVLGSNCIFINCEFTQNDALLTGGGLYATAARIACVNCRFFGNRVLSATGGGGAIKAASVDAQLANCIVQDSRAAFGAGLQVSGSHVEIDNCTFTGNRAVGGGTLGGAGGGVYVQGEVAARNSVFWNDAPQEVWVDFGTFSATQCLVQGGWPGEGNTNDDPLLTPEARLQSGSPCIDGGDVMLLPPDAFDIDGDGDRDETLPLDVDIDGEPRVVGPALDLGADEFVDEDADRLADSWEMRFFGDLTTADAGSDEDGDGLANIDEQDLFGSNPVGEIWFVDPIIGDNELDGRQAVPDGAGGGPKRSLAGAVAVANAGDTLQLAAGQYRGEGNCGIGLQRKPLVVRAYPPGAAVLDCAGAGPLLIDESGGLSHLSFDGLTFRGSENSPLAWDNLTLRASRLVSTTLGSRGIVVLDHLQLGDLVLNAAILNGARLVLRGESDQLDGSITATASWIVGATDAALTLADRAQLRFKASSIPSVLRCDVRGLGDINIERGAQLIVENGALIDLSGGAGTGCADPNQAAAWGTIDAVGSLILRDATIQNANVTVRLGDLENTTEIVNNEIELLQAAPGFGGELFVAGASTIRCNSILSEGDRYLDLDPDPAIPADQRPTIVDNRIRVRITQGAGLSQGELLELRSEDLDVDAAGAGAGLILLQQSAGYDGPWALEELEVLPGAKVTFTNRQGLVFQDPSITDPETLYVKRIKLHPDAVVNLGLQRIYTQQIVDEQDQTTIAATSSPLRLDPSATPLPAGAEVLDVPLLGFSLVRIDMDDALEFATRVRSRSTDPDDTEPCGEADNPGKREGAVALVSAGQDGFMRMETKSASADCVASSVAAKGAFARAADERIAIDFLYRFVAVDGGCAPSVPPELIVYLSDSPRVSARLREVARLRPPMPGRPGAIGDERFARFRGTFSRRDLNFLRGTYVELELRGCPAAVDIDEWDPVVICTVNCGDLNGNASVDEADLRVLVAATGQPSTLDACDDFDGDGYTSLKDLLRLDARLENLSLRLCDNNRYELDAPTPRIPPITPPPGTRQVIAGLTATDLDTVFSFQSDTGECLGSVSAGGTVARLVRAPDGESYAISTGRGVIRLSDGSVAVPPSVFTNVPLPGNDGIGEVRIDLTPNVEGRAISDLAFDPADPDSIYVCPAFVQPVDGSPGYRAIVHLTGLRSGAISLEQVYGRNPCYDPQVTTMCSPDPFGVIVFEPDFEKLTEIEFGEDGRLLALSSQGVGGNDWLLVFDTLTGAEERYDLSTIAPGSGVMLWSAVDRSRLFITWSEAPAGAVPVATVYQLNLPASGPPQLTHQWALSYPPEADPDDPRIVGEFALFTALTENPANGDIGFVGYASPRFGDDVESADLPLTLPTRPIAAVLSPGESPQLVPVSCDDPALPLTAILVSRCSADINGDGVVDLGDLALMFANWAGSGVGDLNGDGVIGLGDLAILFADWRCGAP